MSTDQTTDVCPTENVAALVADWHRHVAEIKHLRSAIKDALGRYQVTHIHAALREAINGGR